MNNTAGKALTTTLCRYFSVGPSSRRHRAGQDLHIEMVEAIQHAATLPGYFSEGTQSALRPGFGAAGAYVKHVRGFRISGTLAYQINSMSPWHFAALLGQMVDANVTNNGEGERFFSDMSRRRAA
jgi:hypothetical protein